MAGRSRAPTQIQVAVETETYIQVSLPTYPLAAAFLMEA